MAASNDHLPSEGSRTGMRSASGSNTDAHWYAIDARSVSSSTTAAHLVLQSYSGSQHVVVAAQQDRRAITVGDGVDHVSN
jgi:hypothetical protein